MDEATRSPEKNCKCLEGFFNELALQVSLNYSSMVKSLELEIVRNALGGQLT